MSPGKLDLQQYLLDVISARQPRKGKGAEWLRRALGALSRLYDVGLALYLASEQVGVRRREKLPVPVVSIGNLTVGGTGKTPMAQLLCRELVSRGFQIALLSRGHGGRNAGVLAVSDGAGGIHVSPDEAGDEPVLLAQTLLSVPVLVGKDRRESGREALRRHRLDALVLDDGLQYWQLARDLDIVLLDADLPFDNGRTLPRGLLREPAKHIRRAGIVVYTRSESLQPADRTKLRERMALLAPKAAVFFGIHQTTGFLRLTDGGHSTEFITALRGKPVLALSGIARPETFYRSLTDDAGCDVVHRIDLKDHHKIMLSDIDGAVRMARKSGAKAIVITEKDSVKWAALHATAPFPVYVLTVAMQIDRQSEFIDLVVSRLFGKERA